MDSAYSPLKPVFHVDQLETLRAGRYPVPVHVQLVLSDLCNQDCSFCAYRMSGGLSTELFGTAATHNPNRKMPFEKAMEIVEDCARLGVKAIQFTGGGEPTVHPKHLEVMRFAQVLGMQTGLVTNGVKMDPAHPSIRAMTWVRVSVDAGTAESYAHIRGVSAAMWGRVWGNVKALSAGYEGKLGVGFVVTPANYHELAACARMCEASGVQNMRIGAVFSEMGDGYYGDLVPAIHEAIAKAKAVVSTLEVIDLFDRRMKDLDDGRPTDEFCGYQHFNAYIGADLNVYRCCNTAYTTRGTVASLKNQRLAEFFDNPATGYKGFDARNCTACQFNAQNKAIASLLTAPEHVNFV